MICHICKDKVASIRLKEIIDNIVTELHLCQACFETRETQGTGVPSSDSDKSLASLVGAIGKEDVKKVEKCDACGATVEDLREKGRLGCSDCYEALSAPLEPLLQRVHGATEHRGKLPRPAERKLDLKNELRRLQEDLHEAIVSENYERAAKIRDKIRQYETA